MENDSVNSFRDELNSRQKTIVGDYSGYVAIIAGLGGIGSWLAIDLALVGVGTVILFDSDKIEASNLNRTLFKLNQIGQFKTKAVRDLIMERRKDTLVIANNEYFTPEQLRRYNGAEYVFDCTDKLVVKDSLFELKKNDTTGNLFFPQYIKLGYDGYEGTLCINDFSTGIWGEDSSYTITPSFFGTPQILSALAVIEMLMKRQQTPKTVNLNVKRVINLLTDQVSKN